MNGQQVGAIAYDASINTAGFIKDAGIIDSTAKGLGSTLQSGARRSFSSFASTASNAFGSVASGIASLAKVAAGLFIGGAFGVGTFIKQASELQGLRASFESMTGSAKDARKVLGDLNKFSFETAFSSLEINKAAQLLLGAGLETKKLGDYMKAIGDVAGATGADLGALTLPLSQALARGKIQTQDFYQILNSGAGKLGQVLRKELADRGMGDFQKAMEDGKVTSEILFDVIQKSAQKGGFAFEGALKQSKTFTGQLSNLQETISNVALELLGVNKATGEIDPNGVFAKISKAVQEATIWLNANKETIKKIAETIITNFVPAVAAITAAFVAAKLAAIGLAIAATPALLIPTLIAGAIIGLIALFTFLYVKFEGFRKGVATVLNFIKENWLNVFKSLISVFAPFLGAVVKNLGLVKSIFANTWKDIKNRWNEAVGFFRQIWTSIKNVFGPAVPFFSSLWNKIKGKLVDLSSNIGTAVGNAFKAPVNGAIIFLERVINSVVSTVNNAISLVDKFTPGSLPRVTGVSLPKLADGGIVKATPGGVTAVIGEGGKDEAVIPLDKLESMMSSKPNQSQAPQVNINIDMKGIMASSRSDLRLVAKDLIESINEELRAKQLATIPNITGRIL